MGVSRLTVVLSHTQGRNPAKIDLVEQIAAGLEEDPDVDVLLIPHLYDVPRDHSSMLSLRSVPGDVVVLAWLYPRATRWILDRNGVRGRPGITSLDSQDEEEPDDETRPVSDERERRGIGAVDVPDRILYCVDLRADSDPSVYLDEIRRIAECATPNAEIGASTPNPQSTIQDSSPATRRRWYPVIDYDRCTNCMECIDFCLFGVYGVDSHGRILVEEQDNCKKGCPACSRVCPENAIIFPGHKMPAIAGADGEVAGLKIDLSRIFGAPSALDVAAQEREAELRKDGRETAGPAGSVSKRPAGKAVQEPDDLDNLIDGLDNLDL